MQNINDFLVENGAKAAIRIKRADDWLIAGTNSTEKNNHISFFEKLLVQAELFDGMQFDKLYLK